MNPHWDVAVTTNNIHDPGYLRIVWKATNNLKLLQAPKLCFKSVWFWTPKRTTSLFVKYLPFTRWFHFRCTIFLALESQAAWPFLWTNRRLQDFQMVPVSIVRVLGKGCTTVQFKGLHATATNANICQLNELLFRFLSVAIPVLCAKTIAMWNFENG